MINHGDYDGLPTRFPTRLSGFTTFNIFEFFVCLAVFQHSFTFTIGYLCEFPHLYLAEKLNQALLRGRVPSKLAYLHCSNSMRYGSVVFK